MWKSSSRGRMNISFKKRPAKRWRLNRNRSGSKWTNGRTLGLIGGGVSLLAGTTYYFMKRQGEGGFTQQGQRPSRSHISMS